MEEIRNRLVPDIKGECQEADANETQAEHLIPFPLQSVGVNRHSPQQHRARRYLYEAINSESHQRDAARNHSRNNGN